MQLKLTFALLLLMSICSFANDTLQIEEPQLTEAEMEILITQYMDSIESTLVYDQGTVTLRDGIATINVPDGFKYLNGEDSEMILTEIWGNPPSPEGAESLGMLLPKHTSPMQDSSYAINITFSDEGYIEDDDAKEIDYTDLLETMQEDSKYENEQREQMGYPTVELIRWASPPFYDEANKKLHWAKELSFASSPEHTLNYNIRILGRSGYLQLNAIGEMYVLDDVKDNIDPILSSVNFNEGHRYADFNPSMDKVAAVGIGGLIAGKVLAKAGFFAKAGVLLAKFWKVIAVGAVALFAGVRRLFGRKEEEEEIA